MRVTNNRSVYAIAVCISILHTGCTSNNVKNEQTLTGVTVGEAKPSACVGSLDYYNQLPDWADDEPAKTIISPLPVANDEDVCLKLREAVRLSVSGNNQQSDKKALELLSDLKGNGMLSGSDLQFTNMLLRQVSQRQNLRKMIDAQEKRLVKTEMQNTVLRNQLKTIKSQLNELKNIEVEIDKKERSVNSTIVE